MFTGQLPLDFGRMLASLRQRKMTQAELSTVLGVDSSTISRYERGDLVPSLEDAQKLLSFVGTVEASDYAEYIGQHWRFLPRPSYDHPDRSTLWLAERALG